MVELKVYTGFWWENLIEGDQVEDSGVNGIIVSKCILKKWDCVTNWIALA
jgi:hypothetical protein